MANELPPLDEISIRVAGAKAYLSVDAHTYERVRERLRQREEQLSAALAELTTLRAERNRMEEALREIASTTYDDTAEKLARAALGKEGM